MKQKFDMFGIYYILFIYNYLFFLQCLIFDEIPKVKTFIKILREKKSENCVLTKPFFMDNLKQMWWASLTRVYTKKVH